jgi:hypothetical protein
MNGGKNAVQRKVKYKKAEHVGSREETKILKLQ